jgi:hypothetical protein
MAKDDQTVDFERILSSNLQRVIDFLKYAEAKNGALLTVASAWVLAIISLLSIDKPLPSGIGTIFSVTLPLFIGAGVLALLSFFPRIDLPWFLGGRRAGPHPKNLLFFGDIASMTTSEYEQAARERYSPSGEQRVTDDYIHDLLVQIAVNSQITCRKLRLFAHGLRLIAIAAAIAFFPIIGWAFHKFWGA